MRSPRPRQRKAHRSRPIERRAFLHGNPGTNLRRARWPVIALCLDAFVPQRTPTHNGRQSLWLPDSLSAQTRLRRRCDSLLVDRRLPDSFISTPPSRNCRGAHRQRRPVQRNEVPTALIFDADKVLDTEAGVSGSVRRQDSTFQNSGGVVGERRQFYL
jgi:hypothetical protein